MSTFQKVNKILAKIGLKLERVKQVRPQTKRQFYNPPSSCQIPELPTLYKLFLGERKKGFFVEVGAFDGISFSNSSCLADVGWSGILIEPVPHLAQACRERYYNNKNIYIIECAAGATNSTVEVSVASALSSINDNVFKLYKDLDWSKIVVKDSKKLTVQQQKLDDILDNASLEIPIDVLVVDVEGYEEDVFAGFTVSRWKPRMMIVELAHTHSDLYSVSSGHATLQNRIESEGYTVVFKNAINTVFVLKDLPGFSESP